MIFTLCWHCSHEHLIDAPTCPICGATNANADLEQAYREMDNSALIALPYLLREQAA